jgi:hypothetical protein
VTSASTFSNLEWAAAAALAATVEATVIVLLALSTNEAIIVPEADPTPRETPIEVHPVLDLPLLKKGSKRVEAKLPDMWQRKVTPVKRYEARSAPTPQAKDEVPKAPTEAPLLAPDETAPPEDAELAKKIDEDIPEVDPEEVKETNLPEEGSPDGVKEGTETDPLKAFAVSQYKMRISGWFNARFKRPSSAEIPCEELKTLRASVVASVSGSRTVASYSVVKPSGNALFDQRVDATLAGIVSSGAELPPPPPNYPDILGTTINVGFFVPSCD